MIFMYDEIVICVASTEKGWTFTKYMLLDYKVDNNFQEY